MLEQTKRIPIIQNFSFLSKVEPGAGGGLSHQLRPKSTGLTGSGSATLNYSDYNIKFPLKKRTTTGLLLLYYYCQRSKNQYLVNMFFFF